MSLLCLYNVFLCRDGQQNLGFVHLLLQASAQKKYYPQPGTSVRSETVSLDLRSDPGPSAGNADRSSKGSWSQVNMCQSHHRDTIIVHVFIYVMKSKLPCSITSKEMLILMSEYCSYLLLFSSKSPEYVTVSCG